MAAIAPLVAQVAVPAAVQIFSQLLSKMGKSQAQAQAAPPAPPEPAQQQYLAQATGKGLRVNVFA